MLNWTRDTTVNVHSFVVLMTSHDVVIPVPMGLLRVAFVSVAQLHVLLSWGLDNV